MIYRLVVLTHGDSDTLQATRESFERWVTPQPDSVMQAHDGNGEHWPGKLGFCGAVRKLWKLATDGGGMPSERMEDSEFVFWLEHDFVFTKRVDVRAIATTLNVNRRLSQMSLMRGPVNPDEHAAGGLREHCEQRGCEFLPRDTFGNPWLEHDAYFTTNPAVMNVSFMRSNPWPKYNKECEGKYGLDLKARGYTSGVWGSGEPWVKHIGLRTGFGY